MANNPVNNNLPETDSGLKSSSSQVGLFPENRVLLSRELIKIPRRLNILARTAVLIFLILAISVIFIPWTQTITVKGKLSSYLPTERPQEIHAQIKGKIINWKVNEGDKVKEGDLILTLGDINPKFMAPDLIQRLDQSREALIQQRKAAKEKAEILSERIEEMEALAEASLSTATARVSEADNKVQNAEQLTIPAKGALETAKLNLDRSRALKEKGLLSQRDLELALLAFTKAEAEFKAIEADLRGVQEGRRALGHRREQVGAELVQKLLDTKSKRASARSDFAKASKEIADLELKRSNAFQRQKAREVTAPFDGTVVRLSRMGPGEIVHSGNLLFTLVPTNTTPALEMWSSSLDAPLLRPGRPVRLLFNGVPAIPLPAWPKLMAGTFDGQIQVVDQSASENGRFRFWVVPDNSRRHWPPQQYVRQGTQVIGWVILNRVPLWYEIWRRFNLFPPDYESGDVSLKDVFLPKAGRPRK
ncbi:MAG: HlyD family efflux transporter periplasmic adaptor subunit [Candidatus Nitronauta litoralis]|uniref:HlyD family efflux transporter periplasmic adaptor subunit n=1 Tax=Candidatus Nitronauta litoralis TaxID=2705533 RepID=A0A7T0BYJ6_9BACT|nr:MAG: HlyD family efflux transporter periplasmic adaptor subunit [Candidatus Nitronauta litoralis]